VSAVGVWLGRIFLLLATFLLAIAAFAQTQDLGGKPQLQVNNDLLLSPNDIDKSFWANAKPYIDDPLPELQAAVPELKGLDPTPSPEPLPSLLARVGDACVDLEQRMPNVISHEEVITQTLHAKPWRQKFEYLMIPHRTPSSVELEEYRTDKLGRRVAAGDSTAEGLLFSQGFASDWVRFHPGNRSESRFRYLGQQEMDKHKTFVVAFAQIPDLVRFPGKLQFGGTWISTLFQGVVWIDSSDYRIVHMREDLLAPRPDIHLRTFTTKIHFDEVHISKAASSLWLPREVDLELEFNERVFRQRHVYSDYRLCVVKTRILPTSP